ncbi:MAG: hydrogenase formation protein HypD, partial [Spirochaetia bacterium]|nr:hydrogenase formation protein HypD [Spirochaetia bacterium]
MNKDLLRRLAAKLKNSRSDKEIRFMEICGTHTAEFFKTGVKDMFPDTLSL